MVSCPRHSPPIMPGSVGLLPTSLPGPRGSRPGPGWAGPCLNQPPPALREALAAGAWMSPPRVPTGQRSQSSLTGAQGRCAGEPGGPCAWVRGPSSPLAWLQLRARSPTAGRWTQSSLPGPSEPSTPQRSASLGPSSELLSLELTLWVLISSLRGAGSFLPSQASEVGSCVSGAVPTPRPHRQCSPWPWLPGP